MTESKPVDIQPRDQKGQPDGPGDPKVMPSALGATFAERKKATEAAAKKAVSADAAENKAVAKKATASK